MEFSEMTRMNKHSRNLVRFAERAAAIYMNFARRFARNRELSWFWLEMSTEERKRAVLLEFCGCEDLLSVRMPDRRSIQTLSDLLRRLERKAGRRNLLLDDAFLIAAELETSEINDIYARLIGPVIGTPYIMRKKVETLAVDHLQSLIRGARKFRVSAPTKGRLIDLQREELHGAA
jgi:hypothetical protein